MEIVHFAPRIWEILLVLTIGSILTGLVAKKPKLFWPLLLIVNILGVGPSLMKYFFWDKVLTGFIVLGALMRLSVDKGQPGNVVRRDDHKLIFILWIGYMIIESTRGVMVNSDPRIIFWILVYAMLGLLSLILYRRGRDFPFPPIRQFSLIVLVTVLVYNIALLAYGIIIENVLGIQYGRFAAQFLFRDSFVWSPPSISSYPTLIGMPAVIFAMNDKSFRVRMLVLVTLAMMIAAAFYYDSRAAYIIIFCIVLVSLRKIRLSKIITIILIFLPLFYYFTGKRTISDFFSEEIFKSADMVWAPSSRDLPRQKHTVAAFMRLSDNVVTFFVGDGMYSHKTTMIPFMAKAYEGMPAETVVIKSQELRDDDFLRTNAFSALLIDTGVIGMLTLILLFIFTAYKVIARNGPHRVVLLATLVLAFMWQFSVNTTGIFLFYLLFMPCGLVDQLSKTSVPIKNG
jgi:hypothetical protein